MNYLPEIYVQWVIIAVTIIVVAIVFGYAVVQDRKNNTRRR